MWHAMGTQAQYAVTVQARQLHVASPYSGNTLTMCGERVDKLATDETKLRMCAVCQRETEQVNHDPIGSIY